jgi:uracil phosphoribosyltransferase
MIHIVSENNAYLQTLNGKSRNKELRNNELASLHTQIGEVLGQAMLNFRPIVSGFIKTVQDIDCTIQEVSRKNITIVVLMRAGLYVGQGVRNILDSDDQVYLLSNTVDDVDLDYIRNRDIVIVDSVINSGKTIIKYIDSFKDAKSISCISIVMQSRFTDIAKKYSDILFLTSRISDNYYIGAGAIDTGNRLFGTV